MIKYRCPVCAQKHFAPETAAGAKHDCTACGQRVQVPPLDLGPTTLHQASQPTTAHLPNKTRIGQKHRPWRQEQQEAPRRRRRHLTPGKLTVAGGAVLLLALSLLVLALLLRGPTEPHVLQDPEQEEFARVVRANAQDPSGFEIVMWGEKKSNLRDVRFRCKLIAITPEGTFVPYVHESGGAPVLLDDAQIFYSPEGKIKRVHLDRSRTFWQAKH